MRNYSRRGHWLIDPRHEEKRAAAMRRRAIREAADYAVESTSAQKERRMGFFDWLKGALGGAGKEIAETVKETAVEVASDFIEEAVDDAKEAGKAYVDAHVAKAIERMRRLIDREPKLSISAKTSLKAGLDSILHAIKGVQV